MRKGQGELTYKQLLDENKRLRTTIARGNTKSLYQLEQDLERITAERDRMAEILMQIQRRDCPELREFTYKFTYEAMMSHAGVVDVARVLLMRLAEADQDMRKEGDGNGRTQTQSYGYCCKEW